jgi:very-short-patch-repair endonuclease
VDFLIAGSIVLEIDGPHHGATKEYDAIRDTYLMRLGYRILRIPVWVLVSDPSAIVDEIEFELTKTVRNPRYRLGQREAYKEEARELLGEILSRR